MEIAITPGTRVLHVAAATRSLGHGVKFTELMLHDLLLGGTQAADLTPPLGDGSLNVPLGPALASPRRGQGCNH